MLSEALGKKEIMATVAVKDIAKSRKFYEGKLGLEAVEDMGEAVTYKAGHANLLVYESDYAGGYGATVATWNVGADIDTLVDDLKDRGVEFEHYDMDGMTLEGDIHVAGDMRIAWFKDPDGSIIALVNSPAH